MQLAFVGWTLGIGAIATVDFMRSGIGPSDWMLILLGVAPVAVFAVLAQRSAREVS